MRKLCKAGIFIILITIMFGCSDIQIFEEKRDPTKLVELSDGELSFDTYYVKNKTKFSAIYKPAGTASGYSSAPSSQRLLWFNINDGYENLVPLHYKGELIACASKHINFTSVTLERFRDKGYTFGIYGGELKEDGYYHLNAGSNLCKGSSAQKMISTTISSTIRIATINGNQITEDMIDSVTGTFVGLQKGKSYKVGLFSGTYYYETDMVADMHMLQSFEIYTYDSNYIKDTYNGYRCFNMPEDLFSGWYWINGKGLFKYYAYNENNSMNNETEDMNKQYYTDEEELMNLYSQQYSFQLEHRTRNLEVKIQYDSESLPKDDEASVIAYAYAPDKTRYTLLHDTYNSLLTLELTEAMQGKWTVNIVPRSLEIKDIKVDSSKTYSDLTFYEESIVVAEGVTDLSFVIQYEGTGTVNATLVTPSGLTFNISDSSKKKVNDKLYNLLSHGLLYAEAGEYKIRVYHYPYETTMVDVYTASSDELDADIFIIN